MRVLLLTETCHIGGAEVMMRSLALDLRSKGHAVALVAPSNGGDWLHHAMQGDGFPVYCYTRRGAINPDIVRCIRLAVSEFKPDVMHSHLWAMAAYGGLVAALSRVPHVITMHGDGEQTRYLRRRVALRMSFSSARSIVAVSDAMRDDLATSLGVRSDLMHVIANGSAFPAGRRDETRHTLGLRDDETVFVCVGSQIPRKNHGTALAALAATPAAHPWRLLIVGPEGESTNTVHQQAVRLGVADQVLNLGPRQDIPDLLAASDIFLMPSLWEGMPVALVEAMGAGKPIVSSHVGGIPAMLADGLEGVLVKDPMDVQALSAAISRLIGDTALRTRVAANAQKRAQQEYGVSTMTDAYLTQYQGSEQRRA